jgi:hypothetical protein
MSNPREVNARPVCDCGAVRSRCSQGDVAVAIDLCIKLDSQPSIVDGLDQDQRE